MPKRPSRDIRSSRSAAVGSHASGALGGTASLVVAQLLPEHSIWRAIFLWFAPTLSVLIGLFGNAFVEEAKSLIRSWRLKRARKAAIHNVNQAMKSPHLTEDVAANYKMTLAEIDRVTVDQSVQSLYQIAGVDRPAIKQEK